MYIKCVCVCVCPRKFPQLPPLLSREGMRGVGTLPEEAGTWGLQSSFQREESPGLSPPAPSQVAHDLEEVRFGNFEQCSRLEPE